METAFEEFLFVRMLTIPKDLSTWFLENFDPTSNIWEKNDGGNRGRYACNTSTSYGPIRSLSSRNMGIEKWMDEALKSMEDDVKSWKIKDTQNWEGGWTNSTEWRSWRRTQKGLSRIYNFSMHSREYGWPIFLQNIEVISGC